MAVLPTVPFTVAKMGGMLMYAIVSLRCGTCSGDYGIGFLGHSHNSGAYLLFQQLGVDWLCFLCNLDILDQNHSMADTSILNRPGPGNAVVRLTPRDSYHRQIFVQPLGLYLVAEAGVFDSLQIDFGRQYANVSFEPLCESLSSHVRLRIEPIASMQMIGTNRFQVIATSPVKGPCQREGPLAEQDSCKRSPAFVRGAYQMSPCSSSSGAWMQVHWQSEAKSRVSTAVAVV